MTAVIYFRFGTDRQNESSATDHMTDSGFPRQPFSCYVFDA
jgi:hypothetical protein